MKRLLLLLVACITLQGKAQFSSNSFSSAISISTGTGSSNPQGIACADIDGDGKKDMIVGNIANSTFSLFRNISSSGSITTSSFATKVDYSLASPPNFMFAADLDGDGKIDILSAANSGTQLSIYRNTSTGAGAISFATRIDITAPAIPSNIAIADLDNDGKPELITTNYTVCSLSVYPNTSTSGSISFGTRYNVYTGSGTNPSSLVAFDMDGDGKKDVAATYYMSAQVGIFRNTTTSTGSPVIAFSSTLTTPALPNFIRVNDLDRDGKQDIVTSNYNGNNISIFRGTSTTVGTITFASRLDIASGSGTSNCQGSALEDFDGDSLVDIAVSNRSNNTISLFKNQATPGSLTASSFAGQVIFTAGTVPTELVATDLDNDGKPDLVSSNYPGSTVAIFRNQIMASEPTVPSGAIYFSSIDNTSLKLTVTKGNGVRRLVLVKAGSGVNSSPVDGTIYSANPNIGNGSQLGTGNYVVFSDTGNSVIVTGLAQNTTYHFAVFEYNGVGATANFLTSSFLTGNQATANFPVYYSKSSGNLNSLSTWGPNTDGSGTSPASFSVNNARYHILNGNTTIGGNWTIGGTGTSVTVGDGNNAINLNVPNGITFTFDSISIRSSAALSVQGNVAGNKLNAAAGTSVLYYGSGTQAIVPGYYGNLSVLSGSKTMSGNVIIYGTLTMATSINTNGHVLTLGVSPSPSAIGTLTYSAGTISGKFIRWFAPATTSGNVGLFPIGTSAAARPIRVEYTGAPTTGGTIQAEFISTNPGNTGLPILEGTQFIDKAGIDGYWKLTQGDGLSGGTYTATITGTGFTSVSDYTTLRMLYRTGSSWTNPGTSLTPSGSNAAPVLGRSGLTGGSAEFGIGGFSAENPLPVTWLSFDVQRNGDGGAVLNWTTASENNAWYFEPETSMDGEEWIAIGKVNASGNTQNITSYSYTDQRAGKLTRYYRIRQTDRDGSMNLSATRSLEGAIGALNVYPNPVHGVLLLPKVEADAGVRVINMNGVEVAAGQGQSLDVAHLAPGIYTVVVQGGEGPQVARFMKQ
jgi:hypothetical protein